MPLLGAHESVAGGLHLAFDHIARWAARHCRFSPATSASGMPPLTAEEIALFRRKWEEGRDARGLACVVPDQPGQRPGKQAEDSVRAFAGELRRCDSLGIPWAVIHPGSHGGAGIEAGLENVARHLDRVFELAGDRSKVTVLLETTAGQGTGLGSRFEELAWIIGQSRFADRLGVCFDTCHVFAAGYDLRNEETYAATMAEFDRTVGLGRLRFFHLNDARKDLGSRVDRHEHIGRGMIGLEGFRLLLNDRRFAAHPMTLETPKGKDLAEDRENLRLLRSLLEE
jgi:deoxyribonuclease IV